MLLRSSRPSTGDETFMETTRKKVIAAKCVHGQNEVQSHAGNQKARLRAVKQDWGWKGGGQKDYSTRQGK